MTNTDTSAVACATCTLHASNLDRMSTIQVRNVPEEVRRTLKARAAAAGQSLSEYVLSELTVLASQPTLEELTERIRLRGSVNPGISAAEILRAERDAR